MSQSPTQPPQTDRGVNTLSIFGAPGTGKTSLCIALLRERRIARYLAIDPHNGIPAFKVIVGPDRWESCLEHLDSIEDKKWGGGLNPFSASYVPKFPDDHDQIVYQASLLTLSRRNMVLIVDEAHSVMHRDMMDARHPAVAIAKQGRHEQEPRLGGTGAHLWLLSQRPTDVHRDLTAGGERFFFWLQERGDLQYCREIMGREGEKMVRKLRPDSGEFIAVQGASVSHCRVYWRGPRPYVDVIHSGVDLYS